MPLSRRYTPEHAPGDAYTYGMDFSYLIPPGVGIKAASLAVYLNTVAPVPTNDFTVGAVSAVGRIAYARLAGGVDGTDYQIRWQATDTDNNIWNRTALVLCAETS